MLTAILLMAQVQVGSLPMDTRAAILPRIHALCPAVVKMDLKALLKEEKRLATNDGRRPRALPGRFNAGGDWLALGCLRAKLSLVDQPVKANWGVIVPEPWVNQAVDALVYGLNIRPEHPIASELLAAVAIDAIEPPSKPPVEVYEDLALTLERAVLAGSRVASVMRGCVSFQLMVADTAAARYCTQVSLQDAVDSTWHMLRWAVIDLRHGDTVAAQDKFAVALRSARLERDRHEVEAALGALDGTPFSMLTRLAPVGANFVRCDLAPDPQGCLRGDNFHGMTSVKLHTALYRLWDPRNGRPIGLVTYGLRRTDLIEDIRQDLTVPFVSNFGNGVHSSAQPEAYGAQLQRAIRTPRADLFFRQWDSEKLQLPGRLASIEIPGHEKNLGYATGFLFVPSSETTTSWSMTVTTWQGDRGHIASDQLAPLDVGSLAVSDPVFGAARDSVIWVINQKSVVLAPLDALYRGDPVYLYYQIKSDQPRQKLTTTLLFFRQDDPNAATPSLQIRFPSPVEGGLTELQRELDVSRLNGGEYRMVIVTDDPETGATSRQSRVLVIK